MDYVDLLLLSYADDTWIRIHWLANPAIAETLNMPYHHLPPHALLPRLERLFQLQLLQARRDTGETYSFFTPAHEEIAEALTRSFWDESAFDYGLTEHGGALWERAVHAQWERYVYELYGSPLEPAPQPGEIITTSREQTERHLSALRDYTGTIVLHHTVTWATLTPWQATYWKTLPMGVQARFLYDECDDEAYPSEPPLEKRWYTLAEA